MNAIGDFKIWCMLHIGSAFVFSGLAAATTQPASDLWHYRQWGSPILTATGAVCLLTGAALFATTIAMHNRKLYFVGYPDVPAASPPANKHDPQLSIKASPQLVIEEEV